MSLFVSFTGGSVKSHEDKKPIPSRRNSDSSTKSDAGRSIRSKAPSLESDQFTPAKKARMNEEMSLTSKALDEEGGEFASSSDSFALIDEWLRRDRHSEDNDLMSLVTKSLHEEGEAPVEDSAEAKEPKKQDNRKNFLNLTSKALDEEGGFAITSFMFDNLEQGTSSPKSQHFGFFNNGGNTADNQPISRSSTPKNGDLRRPSLKRGYKDLL